jgi:hypothetical protein
MVSIKKESNTYTNRKVITSTKESNHGIGLGHNKDLFPNRSDMSDEARTYEIGARRGRQSGRRGAAARKARFSWKRNWWVTF